MLYFIADTFIKTAMIIFFYLLISIIFGAIGWESLIG